MNISTLDTERALRAHQEAGNIWSWYRDQHPGEYRVRLTTGSVLNIRNLFEANAFVSGLESFAFAQSKRELAEIERIAAEAVEREDRLAHEKVIEQLAIGTVDCETCGSAPGTKCLREPREPSPWAAKVHAPRRDTAVALQQLQVVGQPVAA